MLLKPEFKTIFNYKGSEIHLKDETVNAAYFLDSRPLGDDNIQFYIAYAKTPGEAEFEANFYIRAEFITVNGESAWIALEKNLIEDGDVATETADGVVIKKKDGRTIKVPDIPKVKEKGKCECPVCFGTTNYTVQRLCDKKNKLHALNAVCDVCGCPGVYVSGGYTMFIESLEEEK